jgi:hypothetical protein
LTAMQAELSIKLGDDTGHSLFTPAPHVNIADGGEGAITDMCLGIIPGEGVTDAGIHKLHGGGGGGATDIGGIDKMQARWRGMQVRTTVLGTATDANKPTSVRAVDTIFENELWVHLPDLIEQRSSQDHDDHANSLTRRSGGDTQGGGGTPPPPPAHVVDLVPLEASYEKAHRRALEAQQATRVQAQWRGFACRDRRLDGTRSTTSSSSRRWWENTAVPRRDPRSVDSTLEVDGPGDGNGNGNDDDDLLDAQGARSDSPSDDVSVGDSDPRSDVLSEFADREDSIGGESDESSFLSLLGYESVTRLQARWRGFAARFLRARGGAASPCEDCENGKRLFEHVSDDDDDACLEHGKQQDPPPLFPKESDPTWPEWRNDGVVTTGLRWRSRDNQTTMSPRDPREVQDSNTQTSPAKEEPIAVQDSKTQTSPAKGDDDPSGHAPHSSNITLSFAPIRVFLEHQFVADSLAAETTKPPRTTGCSTDPNPNPYPKAKPRTRTRTRTRTKTLTPNPSPNPTSNPNLNRNPNPNPNF